MSNKSRIKSQNLNVFRIFLQLFLPNPLKSGVKSGMRMYLEQHRKAMFQLHLSDEQFYCLLCCDLYLRLASNEIATTAGPTDAMYNVIFVYWCLNDSHNALRERWRIIQCLIGSKYFSCHHNDVRWVLQHLKSRTTQLFQAAWSWQQSHKEIIWVDSPQKRPIANYAQKSQCLDTIMFCL